MILITLKQNQENTRAAPRLPHPYWICPDTASDEPIHPFFLFAPKMTDLA